MMRNILLSLALCAVAMGANAYENDEFVNGSGIAAGDTSKVYDIDEVVIISQPKENFRLRQQPISSVSFSADQITQLGTRDLRELSSYVPSFAMPEYGSRLTSSMYIRGIGSRVNNPAVGIYVDGIPVMSKSAFNTHAYGLERVDVLRGPQGSLYGQNTEGGLVRMYTLNPMRYQGTDVKLSLGTHFYRSVEAAHYARLSEKTALSVAGFYDGQNGFFWNKGTGERADKMNEAGGRLRLVFLPTNRLTIDWVNDYQYVRQNGFAYGRYDAETGEVASPATNRQSNYRRNMFLSGLGLKYQFDGFDLSSNTSYQFLKDYMFMDQDYKPEDLMRLEQRQLQNALTQEFALKSTGDGPWHWTIGVFGSYSWLRTDAPVYFGADMNANLSRTITDYAYYGMLNSMAQRMGEAAAAAMIERMGGCHIDMQVGTIPGLFHTPTSNLAVFHQTDFDITDQLMATVGLRYDYSHTAIDYATSAKATLSEDVMGQHVDASVLSELAHEESNHFDQLLPKFGLTYKFNDGGNVYATVAKGYRTGGFNIQMFSDILQTELQGNAQAARGELVVEHADQDYENMLNTISYKPETSWNYEVGSHLNLFDSRVHLDIAAFYMQVRNLQLSKMAGNYGYGRTMVNAGKSFSCGFELAARGQLLDNRLMWNLGYGITHSEFKEYTDEQTGSKEVIDYSGKRVPFVPMHTLNASLDYRIPFTGEVLHAITLGANFNMQGSTYWNEDNTLKQKPYGVLGAHADAQLGLFTLSLWGRNLTNTCYNTFLVQSGGDFAQRGNPIQLGFDLRMHF